MYTFTVNQKTIEIDQNMKLLTILRDRLGLTSVKDGCSEGACGACMVLVDGRAVKACVPDAERLQGKNVLTVEGLSEREKTVYGYAFASAGAVQCGFCTPGMVISAKALINSNPEPDRQSVKRAIKNNICRCTGYQKIEGAILLAAQMLRENAEIPAPGSALRVGDAYARDDAYGKTLGTALYANDLTFDGMLYGGAVRSRYPRARVLSVDVSDVKNAPGVVSVITAADLPGAHRVGHLRKDQYVLVGAGEITTFLGDPIVLIAARTREQLEHAKALAHVEYEPLPAVFSAREAMAQDAPRVHDGGNLLAVERLVRGDADARISESTHVVTRTFTTPPTEHAFLEPETAVAVPEDYGIVIYSGDQGVYQTRRECAEALGLPQDKVRVSAVMVGGGFGGKEDMSVQHLAALLAMDAGLPVKVSLSRQESLLYHPKRHAMELNITAACDEQGILTAFKARIISDTGAFASLGGPVLQRACTHAAGPYVYSDIDVEGRAYYTNNPPGGAFRGFGVTQSCFAMECCLNLLAEKVGISPWEIRRRNAVSPGKTLPNGQIADDSTALIETLEAVKPFYDAHPGAGIACGMKNSGLGMGIPDIGRCRLSVGGGKLHIHTSAACIGQGMGGVCTQMVCEVTGLDTYHVIYHTPDTALTPDSGNTTASRQTLFTGEAVRRAAQSLMESAGVSRLTPTVLAELEGREFSGRYEGITDKKDSGLENPVSHVAYGYATHVVALSADGRIEEVMAAHDAGRAVNPLSVEGQIEGGVLMSLGFALSEDFPLKDGKPTVRFATLGLLRATDAPPIHPVIVSRQDGESAKLPAFGAKGVGELSAIPTAPAAQNAYYNRDRKFRTTLPLEDTPYDRRKK